MTVLMTLLDIAGNLPTLIPDPDPEAPPGVEGPFALIIGWGKWIALALAVLGIIVVAVTLMFNSRRGEAGRELGNLGWIIAAIILASGAVSFVGFILDA
ncbi:MAG: hypothetical protein KF727_14175 [Microbacteriaceae bacterium]|nr:hypothetical protein [Microbacteriaceae bacterium]